uniref:TOX high mobility group box family member 2 n=1 Tax=Neogobius melanostomus TaxID=47308 RepID=A0A8C6UAX4_9GOBI
MPSVPITKYLSLLLQNYSSQGRGSGGGGAGDEDYEIPPITPPNHADPSLLHLMEHETGYPFHSLPHNGLLNSYSYPELPALMMSNMLAQDTHLLSGPMHSVRDFTYSSPSLRLQYIRFMLLIVSRLRLLQHRSVLSAMSSRLIVVSVSLFQISGDKRSSEMMKPKPKPQKKKKKKDPNEPQKPVSAYALFFRDTQAAIKGQNPNATFGDVSKIVASMWDSLGEEQKQAYKRKTEAAKKEYLKALAAYRASLVSKVTPTTRTGLGPMAQTGSLASVSLPQGSCGYNSSLPPSSME